MEKLILGKHTQPVKYIKQPNGLKGIVGDWNWSYLLFFAIVFISFSCQENKTEQDNLVIEYSVDTVIIDSKERILDVAGYMQASDLNVDGRSFFLYNHHDHSIDEIEHEENLTQ